MEKGDIINGFNKIEPVRAYQAVIGQLEGAIVSGRFNPGEKLPAERELIDAFGTSRRTLREAFRVLEQKGLIEIKIGSKGGTFVADRVGEKLTDTLSLFIRRESISQAEITEFRAAAEGAVAALAAKRATTEDHKSLERYLSEIKVLVEIGPLDIPRFVELEMALHQHMAQICGNALYVLIVNMVNDLILRPAFLGDRIDRVYVRQALVDWQAVLGALQRRTPQKARQIMEKHVFDFADPRKSGD